MIPTSKRLSVIVTPSISCLLLAQSAAAQGLKDARGQVTGLVLHQGGRDIPAQKIK